MSDEVQRMDFEKPESYAEAAKRIRKEHGLPELAPKASVPVLPPMQVDPETIQKADQRAIACVNMRLAGAPFWEIAQTLEYANAGSAKAAFIAAMAEMNPPEDWETLRQQEAMRAEQQLRRSIAMASADYLVDDETGQRIPNTEKLKWHEQASKDIALHVMITGAKAPNRIEVSATVQELNAMVNTLIAKQGGELEELEADVLAMDDLPPEAEPMGGVMANDWRQVIRDQVAVRAAEANQRTTGTSQNIRISRVGFSPDAHPYLVRAARKRGISLAGYIRRATMAMVALDLDMDARDLFELDMAIRPITNRERPSKDLDGELYGSWEVRRGPGAS